MGGQPGQQILIALCFGGVGIEAGSDYAVTGILDAKDQIAAGLILQGGFIGQGGEVFTDLLGISIVMLELKPLCFTAKPS